MRIASFQARGVDSWGVVLDRGIVDVGRRDPRRPTVLAALSVGDLHDLAIETQEVDFFVEEVEWQPVVTHPGKILCVGLNYKDHMSEVRREPTKRPTIFSRFADSQTGHLRPIAVPTESAELDFEGELAVIIGKACRRVAEADAMAAIAGYSCYNDVSVRDFQRHSTQWTQGKNWPNTGAFGPWMVSANYIKEVAGLRLETRLNGSTVQSAYVGDLIFSIPAIIAYCSTWTPLSPGDIIVTGTPGGVGMARNPSLWMRPGDVVEVDISEIGCLTNPIRSEIEV